MGERYSTNSIRTLNEIIMKKFLLSMVCLFLCVMVYAQQKTVNVEEAGTLSTLLSEDEVENLTDLKLTGNINGSDICLIRKMGGAQNHWEGDGFGATNTSLTVI
jgi:hypothetical protein